MIPLGDDHYRFVFNLVDQVVKKPKTEEIKTGETLIVNSIGFFNSKKVPGNKVCFAKNNTTLKAKFMAIDSKYFIEHWVDIWNPLIPRIGSCMQVGEKGCLLRLSLMKSQDFYILLNELEVGITNHKIRNGKL